MVKLKSVKKFVAVIANISLLLNSFIPFLLVVKPAYAQSQETTPTIIEVTPAPETTITSEVTVIPTESPIPTTEPTIKPTITPAPETTITPTIIPTSADITVTPEVTPTPEITPEVTTTPEVTPTFSENNLNPNNESASPPESTDNSVQSAPTPTPIIIVTPTILEQNNTVTGEIETIVVPITQSRTDLLNPQIFSDKPDYHPTEIAIITGHGFLASTTYTIKISSTDEPAVNFEREITSDTDGEFTYSYQLDGKYRPNYKVEIKDTMGSVLVSTTFTDSAPPFNGSVTGFVGKVGYNVSGNTTGTGLNTTISGTLTGGVEGQWATFSGTISGDIDGNITGKINYNGADTLFAEITGSGASGHVYLIGQFDLPGDGNFSAKFITRDTPIDFIDSITVSGLTSVSVGETAQMSATLVGGEAGATVAWSVWTSDGINRANINQTTGLLTATSVGNVTVIASALDGSLVTQNYPITITANTTPPSCTSGVLTGNGISNTVQLVLTCSNLSKFVHSGTTTADATDLSKIKWDEVDQHKPSSATISGNELTLTFNAEDGTFSQNISIDAGALANNSNISNNAISIVSGSITDNAKPIVSTYGISSPKLTNTPISGFGLVSTEGGNITLNGGCAVSLSSKDWGNTETTLGWQTSDGNFPDGVYSSCTITLTDSNSNFGTTTIPSFIVDTTGPVTGDVTISPMYSNNGTNYISSLSNISAPVSDAGVGVDGSTCEYSLDGANVTRAGSYIGGECVFTDVITSGATVINVRAQYDVGNLHSSNLNPAKNVSVTIDGTAPILTIPLDVTIDATGVTTSVEIGTATATDNSGSTPTIINNAPDTFPIGPTTVTWTATDFAGNNTSAAQIITVEDTTPPSVGVSGAPANWINSDQTAGVTCNDANSGCNTATNAILTYSSNPGSCSTTYSDYTVESSKTISSHQWVCTAEKDNSGNTGFSSPIEFKVDKTLPTISAAISAGTTGLNGWYTSDVTVHFTCSDLESGVLSCPSDQILSSEGSSISSTAQTVTDNAGNTSASSNIITVNIDKSGPSADLVVSVGTTGLNGWYTSDVTVATSCSDGVSSIESYTSDQYQTDETSGQVFNGWCENRAGLTTNALPLTIKLDKTSPAGSITSPNSGDYLKGLATINATASDSSGSGVSVVKFYHNPPTPTYMGEDLSAPYSFDWDTTNPSVGDGGHNIYIKVFDNAGNESGYINIPVTVDNTAPAITGVSTTTANGAYKIGQVIDFSVTFDEIVNVNGGTPEFLVTAGPERKAIYSSGSGTTTLIFNYTVGTNDGTPSYLSHTNGNISINGATIKDTVGNDANLSPPDNSIFLTTHSIVIDTTVPTATVSYDVTGPTNGSVVATITPSESVTGDTTHTFTDNGLFTFNFTDTAGNSGNAEATVSNIDKTIPVISLNSTTPDVEINHTYTEQGATADDGTNGSFAATVTGSVDTSKVGSYTIYYNYTDPSGNSAIEVTRIVKVVDTIAKNFATVSANLAEAGIANNLNLVNSNNVSNFSNLYFEKSVVINGVNTKMGKITFTSELDLSKDETTTFLQNLGTKMDMTEAGVISLDFSGTTSDLSLKGKTAKIEFYGLDKLGFTSDSTSDEINSKLVAYDDNGNILNKSDLVNSPGVYTPPVGVCEVGGACYIFSVNVNHFTKYKINELTQTTPDSSGDASLSGSTNEVIITDPKQDVDITIANGTTDPKIDVSAFIKGGTGILPQITINSDEADVAIPGNVTVTGPSGWNGVIAAPTVTTVFLPETTGETKTLSIAIELGFTDAKLSFDKAVRILLPGQAGKRAGYSRPGTDFTEITNICSADNQDVGDALAADGDCKIDVGSDMVIWTKHFTKFASYTQTTNSSSNNDGGSTGSASAPVCNDSKPSSAPVLLSAVSGVNSVTLSWSKSNNPVSYYLVAYGTKSGSMEYGNPNVGNSDTTSYTIKGLSGGTTYYFKVRAGNGCMPGDFSNELSARPSGVFIETPATGFEPNVLGETITESNLSPTPTPTEKPLSLNKILGLKTDQKGFNWWWLLLLIPAYFVGHRLIKKK